MGLKIYEYKNCQTCQKAIRYLESAGIQFERLPIVDQPPSVGELRKMLAHLKKREGSLKHLFNISGQRYRELKISERLSKMTEDEALQLLAKEGKLIKRPFLISDTFGTVGFKEADYQALLKNR